MIINVDEQETVINFGRTDDNIILYTSDKTWMTKMDKLVNLNPDSFSVIEETEVSKRYSFPKSLLTIRSKKRILSDEQKEKMREHMNAVNHGKHTA